MEKLKLKYDSLLNALNTLEMAIENFDKIAEPNDFSAMAARDSLVKRFEYTFDGFWKYLKSFMEKVKKIELDSYGPRAILKDAKINKLIDEVELIFLLDMLDCRNFTSHIYKEEISEMVAYKIKKDFYRVIQDILFRLTI